jgi:hypothetical protein
LRFQNFLLLMEDTFFNRLVNVVVHAHSKKTIISSTCHKCVYIYTRKMITLFDLVQSKVLCKGDHLSFSYKGHAFSARVDGNGVLGHFRHNDIPAFSARLPFDSLSVWADNCIQELAREYVTRFSAWKRVKHERSGLCMNTLRQLHSQFCLPKPPVTAHSLASLRQYVSVLLCYNAKLERTLRQWERFQVGISKRTPEAITYRPSVVGNIDSTHRRYMEGKAHVETRKRKADTVRSAKAKRNRVNPKMKQKLIFEYATRT